MRSIKFRAWDEKNKYMIEPFGLKNITFKFITNPNHIYMQYTGLKDKQSKEIYEGDIVVCSRPDDDEEYLICVKDIRNLNKWLFGSNFNWKKIIGNIYENPKLLKKVKK